MIGHTRYRTAMFVLAVWVAVALVAACGDTTKKSTEPATDSGQTAAVAGINTCATCHTVVAAEWLASRHANLDSGGALDSAGSPTLAQISGCTANCHDPNADSGNIIAAGYLGSVARPVVGCEACHGGGSLHAEAGGAGPIGFASKSAGLIGATVGSAQFNTCTTCHELLDSAGTGTTATAAHDAGGSDPLVVPEGVNTNRNSITDTHFATPGAWPGSGAGIKDITGYAMSFAGERVCTNCHNPHKTAAINREWAQSAHGDRNAIKQTYLSGAWAHYNWSQATRATCQRCHTTTGFTAYADAIREGNTAAENAIRLGTTPALTETTAWKPEMLVCNGCHTDNKGNLRNPGAVTANYDLDISGGGKRALASYAFPDIAGSNVCMLCHTGRENGDTIKGLNDSSLLSLGTITSANFSNLSFINSHYLSAGGTVFTATGYEFDGRIYANSPYYRHSNIGTPAEPGTGANGPCIGCHMSRQNKNGNHLFMPVSRSTMTAGEVTGLASEVCFTCHGPSPTLIIDMVKEQKEQFHEGLEAAMYVLGRRGMYFREAHPYFYQVRTASTTTTPVVETVSVTVGSATVTGTGTLWTSGTSSIVLGANPDYFKVDNDGTFYKIKSPVTATSLTLERPYAGVVSGAGLNYTIIRSGTAGGVSNWLTKAGTGITRAASTDTDTTGATTGKNNMGAAFNLNLLEHDPGSYVHNRIYVKRLLYDSIDWSDDNSMNYSVGATLDALGTLPFKEKAMQYLLPNGTLTGTAAERP